MIRHFFKTLDQEDLLGFLLVVATTAGLLIDAALKPTFEPLRLVPIGLSGLYIVIHARNVWRLARETHGFVSIPYSICLAQTNEWYRNALRQQEDRIRRAGIPWDSIKKTFRIHRLDWAYFDNSRLSGEPAQWLDAAKHVDTHFGGLANRIELPTIYHIFLVTPAPIALAVGARAGRRIPYVLYQHVGGVKEPYSEICNMANATREEGYHFLNERVREPEMLTVGVDPIEPVVSVGDRVLLVWEFTGHKLPKPYPECGAVTTVTVSLREAAGHIPLSSDWMKLARELASVTFRYLDEGAEVHVLPGVPSTLAFMVGSILGTTNSLHVHYYNKASDGYHRTFALSALH
ncbi:MAG: hypothetical protein GKR94_19380 [Gammaproteobacteria bacterium]|nr:hypothetical protein [Gammaproteobacteria bacterium]